ncbi:MAG: 16S rRNA (cytidine(1402)-2'-O)-methyltransferase [Candidatus Omnitrophica bacterium]|nr:16S rRNA (cytidine(1402)-2'-O)-methyltransferase [Candidatus Omnitrophota bacterium]MDD5488332.1 16S rRNA (cytidine(1402)-2'-O)-methyltransferase [Candidatus Omnitrophota bacterium]
MGTLYVVSTPIGNLEDMSLRAIRVLKEVDLIAAEDTRRASILCGEYAISTKLTSYHSYNIGKRTPELVRMLSEGMNIALISDSGTPGISDPGSVLISECIKADVPVTAIPGPSAAITALTLSGRPTASFVFEGFLSSKPSRRRKHLEKLKDEERTVVLYESPHRLVKFLEDCRDILGERQIAVARELTKKFEEVKRGTPGELAAYFAENKPRGEFIIVF